VKCFICYNSVLNYNNSQAISNDKKWRFANPKATPYQTFAEELCPWFGKPPIKKAVVQKSDTETIPFDYCRKGNQQADHRWY
jgi:hypothetical protein